jgi:hypothetical protein
MLNFIQGKSFSQRDLKQNIRGKQTYKFSSSLTVLSSTLYLRGNDFCFRTQRYMEVMKFTSQELLTLILILDVGQKNKDSNCMLVTLLQILMINDAELS